MSWGLVWWALQCFPQRCSGLGDAEIKTAKSLPGGWHSSPSGSGNRLLFFLPWEVASATDYEPYKHRWREVWVVTGLRAMARELCRGKDLVRNVSVAFPTCRWQVDTQSQIPLQSGFPQLGCQALKEYVHIGWPSVCCGHSHLISHSQNLWFCFHCPSSGLLLTSPANCPSRDRFFRSSQCIVER